MGDFAPPQQQSTLMQNNFSTNRGVTEFKSIINIENYDIASMPKQMMNICATVSKRSADKWIRIKFDLSELTLDIPNEYVEALNSNSGPDFETAKYNKAIKKRSLP